MTCKKNHRYYKTLKSLPDGQDNQNNGRHVCARCAYEKGICDGLDSKPRMNNFISLEHSQVGASRHKNTLASYEVGYDLGQEISN